jgi:hypothetical protein
VDQAHANYLQLVELRSDQFLVVAGVNEELLRQGDHIHISPVANPGDLQGHTLFTEKGSSSSHHHPLLTLFFCSLSPSSTSLDRSNIIHHHHQYRGVDSCFIIPLNLVVRHSLSTILHSLRDTRRTTTLRLKRPAIVYTNLKQTNNPLPLPPRSFPPLPRPTRTNFYSPSTYSIEERGGITVFIPVQPSRTAHRRDHLYKRTKHTNPSIILRNHLDSHPNA